MKHPYLSIAGVAGAVVLFIALGGACASSSSDNPTGGSGGSTTTASGGSTTFGGSGGTTSAGSTSGGSGGTGATGGACASVDSEASQHTLPVDIIMAVDTSNSMDIEALFVQLNMNGFVNTIVQSNIDAHVVLISEPCEGATPSDCPDSDNGICIPAPLGSGTCAGASDTNPAANYWHIDQRVLSRDAYQRIIDTYADWSQHLRADSMKHFIVISDDNDDHTGAWFVQQLTNQGATWAGDLVMNGIVASQGYAECMLGCAPNCPNCTACCFMCLPIAAEFGEGTNYADLINQTGGVEGDLCLQDFGPVFANVAQEIIIQATIACTYDIPDPPNGYVFDHQSTEVYFYANPGAPAEVIPQVAHAGACNPLTGGWYLDDPQSPTQILLCPATCTVVEAATEGRIEVEFICDPSNPPT